MKFFIIALLILPISCVSKRAWYDKGYKDATTALEAKSMQMYSKGHQEGYRDATAKAESKSSEMYTKASEDRYAEGYADGYKDGTKNGIRKSTTTTKED